MFSTDFAAISIWHAFLQIINVDDNIIINIECLTLTFYTYTFGNVKGVFMKTISIIRDHSFHPSFTTTCRQYIFKFSISAIARVGGEVWNIFITHVNKHAGKKEDKLVKNIKLFQLFFVQKWDIEFHANIFVRMIF